MVKTVQLQFFHFLKTLLFTVIQQLHSFNYLYTQYIIIMILYDNTNANVCEIKMIVVSVNLHSISVKYSSVGILFKNTGIDHLIYSTLTVKILSVV